MEILLGILLLAICIVIVVALCTGKSVNIKITHEYVQPPQPIELPYDAERMEAILERKRKEDQLHGMDEVLGAINDIMTGGDGSGE
jgi:hypothetical protein